MCPPTVTRTSAAALLIVPVRAGRVSHVDSGSTVTALTGITTVLEKVRQLDDALESLGNIKVITWAEYFARHSAVSSATSSQLFKALGDLKPALRTGNSRQISQILVELTGLIEKAIQEVNSAGGDIKIQLPRPSDIGKMT